ncbi:aminoglycoside phosphotransferase family protein [Actinoplanes sp. NBRC 101535]|uniref:aminoglycoside phosphotransferase family protein n=1 Tax=Actinoplanes sp. NBRC 101535 TaxID=3032196 RepID=UPI002556172F|nr:aminoglycoside phosphotransferase family protein [Actinoplanes sp. NBRC 101535]
MSGPAASAGEIDAALVQALIQEQFPEYAEMPVTWGASGWDNQLWRLGDELAVRLPFATAAADALLRKEHRWVPQLAGRLPLPVPVPQRLGEPTAAFPRTWLVTTWVPGAPADREPVTGARAAESAASLGAFLTALHQPAPAAAPVAQGRGGVLADGAEGFTRMLASAVELGLVDDPDAVDAIWRDAAAAPVWDGPPTWIHVDLHPANVLTCEGTLCGVIDFGDLCAGDPACDLAAAWILLPEEAFDLFHAAYRPALPAANRTGRPGSDVAGRPGPDVAGRPGPDAAMLRRARGWAVGKALAGMMIGDAGVHGRPGGKPTWGPPGHAALRRLITTAH